MSSEKALKYNVLGKLSNFNVKDAVNDIISSEQVLDDVIQPDPEKINNFAEEEPKN
jgi:hypothetical protein